MQTKPPIATDNRIRPRRLKRRRLVCSLCRKTEHVSLPEQNPGTAVYAERKCLLGSAWGYRDDDLSGVSYANEAFAS